MLELKYIILLLALLTLMIVVFSQFKYLLKNTYTATAKHVSDVQRAY